MGENPELRTLFNRLTRLLGMFIIPVFVFDGPLRPNSKRGRQVSSTAHWLTDGFKDFITAFRFYCHDVSRSILFISQLLRADTYTSRPRVKQRPSLPI